jgi:hypothetical protein
MSNRVTREEKSSSPWRNRDLTSRSPKLVAAPLSSHKGTL